jgi:Lon protease-like protein
MAYRQLPVFPLPIVLFPGTPQSLHIFEPRYRQLLADCEVGDRTFGISFVAPAPDHDASPAAGAVGCTAHVRAARYLPDGRANIVTTGGDRYVLRSYVECDRLYRVALVELFDDDVEDGDLDGLSTTVRTAFTHLAEALAALGDQVAPPIEVPDDPSSLSFQIAAALDIDLDVKQGLLELRSTTTRLRQLHRIMRRLNTAVAQRVELHLHAKRNGKSGSKVSGYR